VLVLITTSIGSAGGVLSSASDPTRRPKHPTEITSGAPLTHELANAPTRDARKALVHGIKVDKFQKTGAYEFVDARARAVQFLTGMPEGTNRALVEIELVVAASSHAWMHARAKI
jgi:hypothetical protein